MNLEKLVSSESSYHKLIDSIIEAINKEPNK